MPSNNQINLPAGYAPAFAIGFSDAGGGLSVVNDGTPLPVSLSSGSTLQVQAASPAAPSALQGQTSTNLVAGPFAPSSANPIMLTLTGQWDGSVQVERSVDGGATRQPLTVVGQPWGLFTGNACEAVWSEAEEDVEFYLDITVNSGTLSYRVAQ